MEPDGLEDESNDEVEKILQEITVAPLRRHSLLPCFESGTGCETPLQGCVHA